MHALRTDPSLLHGLHGTFLALHVRTLCLNLTPTLYSHCRCVWRAVFGGPIAANTDPHHQQSVVAPRLQELLVADVDFAHFFGDFVPDILSPVAANIPKEAPPIVPAPATMSEEPPPTFVGPVRSAADLLNLRPVTSARHSLVGTAKAHPVPLHLRVGLTPHDPADTHAVTIALPFALTVPNEDAQAAQDEADADARWRREGQVKGRVSEAEVALGLDRKGVRWYLVLLLDHR